MEPLGSIGAFRKWQRELKRKLNPKRKLITICGGTGCTAFGAPGVEQAFRDEVAGRGLSESVSVKRTGCHGFCEKGPVIVILPQGIFYPNVQIEDIGEIIDETVVAGKTIKRLLYVDPVTGKRIAKDHKIPFYARQQRSVFRLNGILDPTDLGDYVARDGYAAAARALGDMKPEDVIDEVIQAGLRGRGGAGFPAGRKWQFCREAPDTVKYLICNADEGDPGAFMDRSLLEGTPHAIIEGMIVAAYAIGASEGIIYVRAEYPLAVENTRIALADARAAGLLGEDILGTGFEFDITIHKGAGAFVCGEETALIASLENSRGMPRPRPPFPAVSGHHGRPTNINNVETFANVPLIIRTGAEAYAAVGTEGSKGTKIFALAGKVNNTGLVEVPMGATLRQIVFDIGGGIPRGRKFKAAQMGGPSGGCVPAPYLDHPIDYDSVKEIGAIMGSGGLIVMDQATCMVDIARFFTDFVQKESCGKCVPCRIGTKRMLEILTRITCGLGELEDIDRLVKLGEMIRESSLCGLGQTAPNPVLSTIRYFRDEYEAHIIEKRCPANSCEGLLTTTCSSACPAHVNIPEYVALIAEGRFADALEVIRRRNPLASVCGRTCDHPCEMYCRRGDMDAPVAIRQLKRFVTDAEKKPADPPLWRGPRTGRVAVIGSGPAGLSAAFFLATMGREVKIFEAKDEIGGILTTGIPEYRLPREAIARDIDYIRRAGVEIETARKIQSLQALRDEGYNAIFIAVGAHKSVRLGIEGEDADGVWDSLAFLEQANSGELTKLDGKVLVIGGGNAAIDSARTAMRLGADSVTLLYRRSREEMPAIAEEVEAAMHEGIEMEFQVAPTGILGGGKVTAMQCSRMELGDADESGRRRPVAIPGSEATFEADHVIVAIGQGADIDFAASDEQLEMSGKWIDAHPVTQRSGQGDVFVGGDALTGPSTIIQAVGAGQRAAQAIDIYLGGRGQLLPDVGFAPRYKPDLELADAPRQKIREVPPAKRKRSFQEVIKGFTCKAACAEAGRCLRCDLDD